MFASVNATKCSVVDVEEDFQVSRKEYCLAIRKQCINKLMFCAEIMVVDMMHNEV